MFSSVILCFKASRSLTSLLWFFLIYLMQHFQVTAAVSCRFLHWSVHFSQLLRFSSKNITPNIFSISTYLSFLITLLFSFQQNKIHKFCIQLRCKAIEMTSPSEKDCSWKVATWFWNAESNSMKDRPLTLLTSHLSSASSLSSILLCTVLYCT